MKLSLQYIGINTDVFPPVLILASGVQAQANQDMLATAFNEAVLFRDALETEVADYKIRSMSIVDPNPFADLPDGDYSYKDLIKHLRKKGITDFFEQENAIKKDFPSNKKRK